MFVLVSARDTEAERKAIKQAPPLHTHQLILILIWLSEQIPCPQQHSYHMLETHRNVAHLDTIQVYTLYLVPNSCSCLMEGKTLFKSYSNSCLSYSQIYALTGVQSFVQNYPFSPIYQTFVSDPCFSLSPGPVFKFEILVKQLRPGCLIFQSSEIFHQVHISCFLVLPYSLQVRKLCKRKNLQIC